MEPTMFIRWLGLYGDLKEDSISFEMSRKTEACAEYIRNNKYTSLGGDGDIGLMCNKAGIVRIFKKDVYSHLDENGRLVKGLPPYFCHSTEAWVKPGNFEAIVFINDGFGFAGLPKDKKAIIIEAHKKFGLPVYQMLVHSLKRIM